MSAKPWFEPKRYGYGGTPASWEGWAAIAVFVLVFGLAVTVIRGWPGWLCAAASVLVFTKIACAKTRGGCRWRWEKSRS